MNQKVGVRSRRELIEGMSFVLRLVWLRSDTFAKQMLGYSFGLLVIYSAANAGLPVIYKLLIDSFGSTGARSAIGGPMLLVAAYIGCQIALHSTVDLRTYVHTRGVQRLSRRIYGHFFDHIIHLPLRYHLERHTGAMAEILSQGTSGTQMILQHLLFTFLPVIVEFLAITVVLIHFQRPFYLVVFAVATLAYGRVFWLGAISVVEPTKKASDAQIKCQAQLTDSLLNYESVKYFCAERSVHRSYDSKLSVRENAWKSLAWVRAKYGLLATAVFIVSLGVAQVSAATEVLRGTMTVGDLVLITSYVARLMLPLQTLGGAARDFSQALGFMERIRAVLSESREEGTLSHHASTTPGTGRGRVEVNLQRGELVFENVSFSYAQGRQVLRNLNFTIRGGTTTGIVGTSGSGKTSIIRLIFRLYETSAGRILLNGKPTSEMPLEALRSAIAIVPQDTILFNDSLRTNVAFGCEDATESDLQRAAERAKLSEVLANLPDGFNTMVGERGLKLSGGEKQRVAIARATLKRPEIFVFDEATSSLDSSTENDIIQNLNDVARGCTTIIIAHRLSTVTHADQILVLDHGEVVESGTHQQLLAMNGAYAGLWRAQQREHSQPNLRVVTAT